MKKVLILAYDFPPYVSVGALRPYSWYKYLHEFGVYPIVVTRQWGNHYGNHLDYVAPGQSNETLIEESEWGTIIRVPYKPNLSNRLLLKYGDAKFRFIRKLITGFYEYAQFLWFVGPKSGLYFGANAYLKKQKVDAIIATGDPFILFKYASILSQKHDLPWIADYRDPWIKTGNEYKNLYAREWQKFFERRYLKSATIITTVSNYFQKQIQKNININRFSIIQNGFDINNSGSFGKQSTNVLTIAYAGTIYSYHPIDSFLSAISQLKQENYTICVNFYGISGFNNFKQFIEEKYSILKEIINIYPKLRNEELLYELSKNNLFLLFNDYTIMGTKIYDYLVLKRKIILCYTTDPNANILKKNHFRYNDINSENKNLQEELIQETNSGILVKDQEHLQTILKDLYDEFKQNGIISCLSNGTDQYSRKIQTQKLAEIIKTITTT